MQAVPILAACGQPLIKQMNEVADLVRIGPGDVLFEEGSRLQELMFLMTGQVAATRFTEAGDTAVADVWFPIRPLCLQAAFLDIDTPVGANAITSARLIALPVAEMQSIVRSDPALALRFFEQALTDVQQLTLEICNLKLHSSAQRLAEYLLSLVKDPELTPARFVLPFEKRLLAARIGCSQENLSRAFAALRRQGVETQRGIVVLRDVPGLRTFCGRARRSHAL